MIRIVGIQRHTNPEQEFILLQNHGNMRVNIRGHVLLAEDAIISGDLSEFAFAIPDEALIPPGMYLLVRTGIGDPKWSKTKDGALVFTSFMNREEIVWSKTSGAIHVLKAHHSYVDRSVSLALC